MLQQIDHLQVSKTLELRISQIENLFPYSYTLWKIVVHLYGIVEKLSQQVKEPAGLRKLFLELMRYFSRMSHLLVDGSVSKA